MRPKKRVGFTIVELLIVVGIIGVLASIVAVAVLGGAQPQAKDNAVKANVTQVRQIASSLQVEQSSYEDLCDGSDTLNDADSDKLASIEEKVTEVSGGNTPSCYADADSFCVEAQLYSGGDFCIDDEGTAAEGSCDTNAIACQ